MTAIDTAQYNVPERPNWCTGCGNFGIQAAVKQALAKVGVEPHQAALSSGIGCSAKISDWVRIYTLHGLHGRSVPIAAGIKLANPKLVVIAEGGDGDGYSEGLNHFLQAARRNVDLTYIVHNNGVFALTTGQSSVTARKGFVSNSTPFGAVEPPMAPLALAIAAGAPFVARAFCGDIEQMSGLIAEAIRFPGFALVDVMQVCVTFNPAKSYKWYQERVYKIDPAAHDASDRAKALALAFDDADDRIATGVIYRGERPTYESALPQLQEGPLVERDIANIDVEGLMAQLV